ncbi:hypothetical protein THRCLA_00354, partial [Thraustotheca clavata]
MTKIESIDGLFAKIVAVGDQEDTKYYVIQVNHGPTTYFVAKRYSEFRALYKQLCVFQRQMCESCTLCQYLPYFPKKLLFSTESSRQRRFEDLQMFLRGVLMAIQAELCESNNMCHSAQAITSFLFVNDKENQAPTMYECVQLDSIHAEAWFRSRSNT